MTTRPGNAALANLRYTRGKRIVQLLQVTRTDGFVLRLTDHNSPVVFDGFTYQPTHTGNLSAERREAGFRSMDQEAFGIVDNDLITVDDLLGGLYQGAEIRHTVTDWRMPWLVISSQKKWIRKLRWDGTTWVATLDGRAAQLQHDVGGRFAGVFQRYCPYKLGDQYCQIDTSVGGGNAYVGCRIASIPVVGMQAAFDSATWPGTYDDDWFRDGEIEWIWGAAEVTGTTSAITTLTTLTDATKSWTTDEHVGKLAMLLTGAGGPVIDNTSYAEITGNTATTLTFAGGMGATHALGTPYEISPYARNYGKVSPIVRYQHSSRTCDFLVPTPYPMAVGDGGIYRVGCDGLSGTCKDKFSNLDRFGGDPFAPSPADILEPPGN